MELCNSWFAPFDAVILERFTTPSFVDLLDTIPTQWTPGGVLKRPKLIYQTDDLIWAVPPDMPNSERFTSEIKGGIRETIRRSDAVICSTPELAEHAGRLNPQSYVTLNAIDYALRDWETIPPRHELLAGKVVIGWAGGDRPAKDFQGVGWAVSQVLKDYPQSILALVGSLTTCKDVCKYLSVPHERAVIFPPVPFDEYPQALGQFDIGIAAISDTPFNRCKSELKITEYGALGIPYVASRVSPYTRFHGLSSGEGGYLCSSPRDWYMALSALVADTERREIMSNDVRRFVKRAYDQEVVADQWERIIREVIADERPTQRIPHRSNCGDRVHSLV